MNQKLIYQLLKHDIIKRGNFTLKSGIKSNLYFDLRTLISYPNILNQVIRLMYQKISNLDFDLICGIAYTGIPMATKISLNYNIPMLIIRKERKDYGTKKLVEGVYHKNQKCLMLDDVITTGSSLIENIDILQNEGINVNDIIVFIDRRNNRNDVSEYNVHSVFTEEEIMNVLNNMNQKIGDNYNIISERLNRIIHQKKTNLVLSADITTQDELLNLISIAGPYICMLKIHIDIIKDLNEDFFYLISKMADVHNFMIMEDRKFADIGNTVKNQYTQGIYNIIKWADFVTVHSIMGEGTLKAIRDSIKEAGMVRGVFLLESVSSEDNLIDNEYSDRTIEMANKYNDIVSGFISQKRRGTNSDFFYAMPGVNIDTTGDNLGQQYNTPENAILNCGADMVIVGRGIYMAEDKEEALKMYRDRAWNSYQIKIEKYYYP